MEETVNNKEHYSKVTASNLPISTKHSIEIANFIRNKNLEKAKTLLTRVISKKQPVPFRRYKRDISHKPGKVASARYPVKASKEILRLLNSLEANAEFKGLDVKNLVVSHVIANKGTTMRHFGRRRRISMKRTNIEIKAIEKDDRKTGPQ